MLLSVIIPTRDRAHRVSDLLDSLARQVPVSFEWEVLVIDNGSTDDTAAAVSKKSFPGPLYYFFEPKAGLHHGRHRGARDAQGTYVGYLDDDMVLAPTWIQGVELLARGQADVVVGRILPKWEASPPKWLSTMVQGGIYGYLGLLDFGIHRRRIDPLMVAAGNSFFPRKLLFDLGGFHPDGFPDGQLRFRGDGETGLMRKIKRAGLRVWYDPSATAYHIVGEDRLTPDYLCRRAYREGISASFADLRKKHLERSEGRLLGLLDRAWRCHQNDFVFALMRRIRRLTYSVISSDYARIQRNIKESFRSGYDFHRSEVQKDPELLAYVLTKSYWE